MIYFDFWFSDSDFHTKTSITIMAGGVEACTDFFGLVVDDNIASEGDEAFTIVIYSSMAIVTIVDDDGTYNSTVKAK